MTDDATTQLVALRARLADLELEWRVHPKTVRECANDVAMAMAATSGSVMAAATLPPRLVQGPSLTKNGQYAPFRQKILEGVRFEYSTHVHPTIEGIYVGDWAIVTDGMLWFLHHQGSEVETPENDLETCLNELAQHLERP